MKEKIKQIIAVAVAVICACVFLTACTPDDPPVEEGYSVVFDYNDGVSRPRTYYTDAEGRIGEPAGPVREGYRATGWFTEREGGTAVSFPYVPTADGTLYARWTSEEYDVTFDFNFEGLSPYVEKIAYNDTVNAPAAEDIPEYEGHYFYRWETRAQNGDAVTFPYTVRRDTTFYAAWLADDVRIYQVAFDANYPGAPTYEPLSVVDGAAISQREMPAPSYTGHELLGWATSADATVPNVTLPFTPSGNVTLYAVWQQQTYRVRFRYNYTGAPGGNAQAFLEERIVGGESVSEPEGIPVREGFEFVGWYNAQAGGEEIVFPYTVVRATTFYARWRANRMTPTNNIFDAEFTPISPTYASPTYSGNATGVQIIEEDTGERRAHSEPYPLLDEQHSIHSNHFVGALYVRGARLTFTIYSSARVSGVTLYASLATEIEKNVTITPEGEFGFQFGLNGASLDYGAIDLDRPNVTPGTMHHSAFEEYRVASGLTLEEGANTITLTVNNDYVIASMRAMSPLVDYIRLDTGSADAALSWHPEYDNLYRTT